MGLQWQQQKKQRNNREKQKNESKQMHASGLRCVVQSIDSPK